jgi:hypothetical protein
LGAVGEKFSSSRLGAHRQRVIAAGGRFKLALAAGTDAVLLQQLLNSLFTHPDPLGSNFIYTRCQPYSPRLT